MATVKIRPEKQDVVARYLDDECVDYETYESGDYIAVEINDDSVYLESIVEHVEELNVG